MRCLKFVEKVCFFKKVLVLNPYPQTPFPGKGARLLGLPPLDPVGGYAPKQGCFGRLPKVLHDAKPTEQAISDPIFRKHKGLSTDLRHRLCGALSYICLFYTASFSSSFSSIVIIMNAIVINTAHIITAH